MKIECKHCKKVYDVEIESNDYKQWKDGKIYLHVAADYLYDWERELLISQTCKSCWSKLYSNTQ
jgi:hypothetical protein